jgi:hypothetical protein
MGKWFQFYMNLIYATIFRNTLIVQIKKNLCFGSGECENISFEQQDGAQIRILAS